MFGKICSALSNNKKRSSSSRLCADSSFSQNVVSSSPPDIISDGFVLVNGQARSTTQWYCDLTPLTLNNQQHHREMGETQSKTTDHEYPEHMVVNERQMAPPTMPPVPPDRQAVLPPPMVTTPITSLQPQTACTDVPFELSPELVTAATCWQMAEPNNRLTDACDRVAMCYQYDFSLERSILRDIASQSQ